jgi:Bacterial inner membrane protein
LTLFGWPEPWPAYLFGVIGVVAEWRAYCLVCDRRFRYWSAAGALFWSAQYLGLQAYTAAVLMACTAVRTLLSELLALRFRAPGAVLFACVFALLTFWSWQGGISCLPAFAAINTTWALFFLPHYRMRWALALSSLAWMANDVYWQAWPALLAEGVALLINLRVLSLRARGLFQGL